MALKRISVAVLICFLSFADAEKCASEDLENAIRACGQEELCITINGTNAKSYEYIYSGQMSVPVECHYTAVVRPEFAYLSLDNFKIKWQKNHTEDITNATKCRNLKTEIQLSPHTGNVLYTCEKSNDSPFKIIKYIKFIYFHNEPISTSSPKPRQTQGITIRPSSKPPATDATILPNSNKHEDKKKEYSATIKVTINGGTIGEVKSTSTSVTKNAVAEAKYYYFNHEMVNVTCALVISDHNPKSYLLEAHSKETCADGNNNGTQISHTQELNSSMATLNYRCSLKIGDKAEGEKCGKIEKIVLFTLQYKFAKLKMYINNELKEEETTENGTEIVFTYHPEDITIQVKCTYDDEVYNRRHISRPAIIWDTKQLGSNSKTYTKNSNTITIPLFADQSNSYLDCVEHLENQVSINKEYQPTRIRLRFIYAKLSMYIDNNKVTDEHKTTNGSEVVYKYKKENVTVVANCSHGAEVYRIPRYNNMSHTPIKWITEKLDSTYKNNEKNTTLIKENSIQIRLFADQNESFVDCVDNLSITSRQNSKIRIKFIYEKDAEVISQSDPKDAVLNKERDQKDAEVISQSDPKDAEPNKERDQEDAEPNEKRHQKDAEAMSTCDSNDAERVMVCGEKEMCITIDNKIVTSYNYSQQMNISVECHYNGGDRSPAAIKDNFTIHWKNGADVISNEEKCRNLEKVIHLSPDTNKTVYTCEKYSNVDNKTEDITFLYVPEKHIHNDTNKGNQTTEENLTLTERLELFFVSNWIVLAAVLVLFIVVIAVIVAIWLVLKSKKSPKEDKRRLNPKGSRESLDDIPKETRSEPKLNEQYTDLNADTVSEVYSDPYSAMYTQPIPKKVRKTKVLPTLPPKPKPRNVENYLNTGGLVYEEPSTYINSNTRGIAENTGATYNNIGKSSKHTGATYNNIEKISKNTGATYNNIGKISKNTGATYNNIEKKNKNTGATYNNIGKISKNTGVTYNNIGKISKTTGATYNNIGKISNHTGTTYNNIDKSFKNTQRVHFYDNMAASYSNADNENYSSDVYSEPGLYEEPS